jgi:hypothetical protein
VTYYGEANTNPPAARVVTGKTARRCSKPHCRKVLRSESELIQGLCYHCGDGLYHGTEEEGFNIYEHVN